MSGLRVQVITEDMEFVGQMPCEPEAVVTAVHTVWLSNQFTIAIKWTGVRHLENVTEYVCIIELAWEPERRSK